MDDFHLIFCDPVTKNNEVEIPFTVTGTDASWRWLDCLYETIYVRGQMAANNRWSGFETGAESIDDICERLNRNISICRSYHPTLFDFEAKPDMTQQDFNWMHTYFEKYRGEMMEPHPLYNSGTDKYRDAVELLNIDIHLMETLPKGLKRANFNFKSGVMGRLGPNDYDAYEFDRKANTLYLQYNMRGKTLYDVFYDQDNVIGNAHIKRAEFCGADFSLNVFGWSSEFREQRIVDVKKWWAENREFLSSLGFEEGDPANTFGWIPVAHTDHDLESLLEPRQFLKGAKFW